MYQSGDLLTTLNGNEFEILECLPFHKYKAKFNNLALIVSVQDKIITDTGGKFIGLIVKVGCIVDCEFNVVEDIEEKEKLN